MSTQTSVSRAAPGSAQEPRHEEAGADGVQEVAAPRQLSEQEADIHSEDGKDPGPQEGPKTIVHRILRVSVNGGDNESSHGQACL